jgi:hypothetical protein
MTVTTAAGTRAEPGLPNLELGPLVIEGIGGIVDDFMDAIDAGRAPMASGDDGLHVLELVLAAYESAALGRTVALPLDLDDPVYRRGALGIVELDMPAWSPVRRQGLYAANPNP